MSRKELVKVFSPPLQFTFNNILYKEKTKSFKKGKLVYLRISVGTLTKTNLKVTKPKKYIVGFLKTYQTKIAAV